MRQKRPTYLGRTFKTNKRRRRRRFWNAWHGLEIFDGKRNIFRSFAKFLPYNKNARCRTIHNTANLGRSCTRPTNHSPLQNHRHPDRRSPCNRIFTFYNHKFQDPPFNPRQKFQNAPRTRAHHRIRRHSSRQNHNPRNHDTTGQPQNSFFRP